MRNRIICFIIAASVTAGILSSPITAKASASNAAAMVDEALKEKTFYHYNMAYFGITKLQSESEKNLLFSKLSAIAGEVWTDSIRALNRKIDDMVKTASGRIYDELEANIQSADIYQIDKEYLLGELTSWGRRLVWTPEYKEGVSSVITAWTTNDEQAVLNAEAVINRLTNTYSREYLLEQWQQAKESFYSRVNAVFVNLTADKPSPQLIDSNITMKASSNGISNPLYRFWLHDGVSWKVVQDYSASDKYDWKPEKVGTYRIWVDVKDAASTKDVDKYTEIIYNINSDVKLTDLTVDKSSPQYNDVSIKFTATSNTSSTQYRFWLSDGVTWRVVQDYSQNNTFNWFPTKGGSYTIWVDARANGSTSDMESYKQINYEIRQDALQGNTAANINNKGTVLINDNLRYEAQNDIRLVEHSSSKQLTWLAASSPRYLNIYNGYMYFADGYNDWKIYKMNLDGSNKRLLNSTDFVSDGMIVSDGYIYYINGSDYGSIYRMNLDGSGRTKIGFVDNQGLRPENLNVTDKYVYYIHEGAIYRVNLDGSGKVKLFSGDVSNLIVDRDAIYFGYRSDAYGYNKDFRLSRINLDGTGLEILSQDNIFSLNMRGDYLYYSNLSDYGKLYAIKKDGTNKFVVNNSPSYKLNIAGDWIYYYDSRESSAMLQKIKIPDHIEDRAIVDSNAAGNLSANILNGAFMAAQGDYIYKVESGCSSIYRYKTDGSDRTLIVGNGISISDINVSGDWLYYTQVEKAYAGDGFPYEGIFKVKLTGNGSPIKLSSKKANFMTLSGQWLYYTTREYFFAEGDKGKIHRLKIDGTGEGYVGAADDYGNQISIFGDYIYYINQQDGYKLYRIKKDGTKGTKLIDESIRLFSIYDNNIYYRSQDSDFLKKASLDGSNKTTLPVNVWWDLIVDNDKIIYTAGGKTYSSNLDGSGEKIIIEDDPNNLNIVGDYLYYFNKNSGNGIQRVKVD